MTPLLLVLLACSPNDEDDATECSDRADNDKDGLVDCMEPACAAYCPTDDTGPLGPTGLPTDTDTGTPPTGTITTDTGDPLVQLEGRVQLEAALNPAGFQVELLGSGQPGVLTDANGNWSIDLEPGTYPWRLTAPDNLPVPSTGTVITVSEGDTDTGSVDQVFDVLLPAFIADVPLPLVGAQPTTGLILTVTELEPVGGEAESDTLGAVLASTPLPIEGVQNVHLMYHMRPFGHTGFIDVELIFPFDNDLELWALDPATSQWRSFGGFNDVGNNRIALTQTLPWVTTLALVTP